MMLMLYFDIWQEQNLFDSIEKSIIEIGKSKQIVQEIKDVLKILIDNIYFEEHEIDLPYIQPLKVHSRYTRDQILVAFNFSSFNKKSKNREGVAFNKILNTELLFINLEKSEENFSPTTMYDDYAVDEKTFHWQSQNSTSQETSKGISYINHEEQNKIILLFVREKATDEYGNTPGYVFLGKGKLKSYYGSKPMSINWELNESIPNYMWKDLAKLHAN
jgi:hypothetical protein